MCHSTFSEANFEILRPSLQLLNNLLRVEDEEILFDTCWAISYISDDTTQLIPAYKKILQMDFYLTSSDFWITDVPLLSPALHALGNILTGSKEQTSKKLKMVFLKFFRP